MCSNLSKSDKRDAVSSLRRFHAQNKTSFEVLQEGVLQPVRLWRRSPLCPYGPLDGVFATACFWGEGFLKEGDTLVKVDEEQL